MTSLAPEIIISEKASVNPASGVAKDFTNAVTYTVTAEDGSKIDYVVAATNNCAFTSNIYAFSYDGKNYELVRENKEWVDAAACAVERGGYLAEINSNAENNALFDEVKNNASIDLESTISGDGGGAAYVWIGGNDLLAEGKWIWDGNNDGTSIHFWQGDASGMAINGAYTKWGNEPDDFSTGQDCLGLALTEWPFGSGSLGSASQWNDLMANNKLYYLIEYD